jgi:FdhE protein
MTTAQTGGNEYDARIRRAERLAAQHSFATEFLDFYKHVAAFQKTLRANIASSNGIKSPSAPAAELPAFELRAPLDLTVLLPHFRGFLSSIEQHAPPALAKSAHQMSLLPSDSWIASLEAYWELGGKYDQQVGAFAQFLPRAFLQPYAEFRAALMPKAPIVMTMRVCPLCAARPLLGVLRPEGDGGKRFLVCSFCSQEWEFRRILCPTCGEEAETKLPVYIAEQLPHIRVEACDTCQFYIRTVDLTKDGHAIPLVDDLAAIPLTLWAHEKGYSRLQPNLLGT